MKPLRGRERRREVRPRNRLRNYWALPTPTGQTLTAGEKWHAILLRYYVGRVPLVHCLGGALEI